MTLALLLAKILNPQVVMPSGFNIQTASINTPQGSVALTVPSVATPQNSVSPAVVTPQSSVTAAIPLVATPQRSTVIPEITPRSINMQVPTTTEVSISVTSSLASTSCEPLPPTPVTSTNAVSSNNSNPNSAMASDTSTNDEGFFLTPTFLTSLTRQCCSRKNFATRLVCQLFDEDTRKKSNVAGKLGKAKLNAVVMDYIKSLTFQHYPLEDNEKEEKAWQACVVAIDSKSRSLNRKQ